MAISPDGRTLLVSASTGNVVHAINVASGKEAWRLPVRRASIGRV